MSGSRVLRQSRTAWVLSAAVVVLAACSAPDRTPTPAPTATPVPTPEPTPVQAGLTAQLEAIETALDASSVDLRDAGRLQQRIVFRLGRDPALRAATVAALSPSAKASTELLLRARDELTVLTRPGTALPKWRIVEPESSERLRSFYREAERATAVPWRYLAAINFVETKMGRIVGLSTAGARGPMQFIAPTWARYGRGDIDDPHDSIQAAGRLLRANGAPGNMAHALYRYNPSERYVRAIEAYASLIGRNARAYALLHAWEVFYRLGDVTYVLPVGYPSAPAARVE
jgi:membrane-bound lytic murein transglycosylase B